MGAVAIVGGGVAGLTAAHRLKQRGVRVVVYEASFRVGGAVWTDRREGYLAELGLVEVGQEGVRALPDPARRALDDSPRYRACRERLEDARRYLALAPTLDLRAHAEDRGGLLTA